MSSSIATALKIGPLFRDSTLQEIAEPVPVRTGDERESETGGASPGLGHSAESADNTEISEREKFGRYHRKLRGGAPDFRAHWPESPGRRLGIAIWRAFYGYRVGPAQQPVVAERAGESIYG